MPSRDRTRLYYEDGGTRKRMTNGSLVINDSGDALKGSSRCQDTSGGTGDNPLSITHRLRDWCDPLNGHYDTSEDTWRDYSRWIPTAFRSNSVTHLSSLAPPSNSALATMLMARTNPSRPHVSLPAFAGELPEIPKLFKLAGETLLKKGANAFLSYQYGWKPLINDMGNFLDFNKAVNQRVDELQRLYSKNGLKRRITLYRQTAVGETTSTTIESGLGLLVSARRRSTSSMHIWGTVRWRPTQMPNRPLTDEEYRIYASRLVLGLQRGTGLKDLDFHSLASDIWQIMPWSWLADWGANIGEYIDAHRNTCPAVATSLNVMKHTKTWRTYSRNPGMDDPYTWLEGGNGVQSYETKERLQPSASLAASLPFLSGTQVAILGALGIQRLKLR